MDLFPLDSSLEELLTITTFEVCTRLPTLKLPLHYGQGKFDVKDFVSSVSEKLITQSKAEAGRMYLESSETKNY